MLTAQTNLKELHAGLHRLLLTTAHLLPTQQLLGYSDRALEAKEPVDS
jgi:hypothetical protein